MHYLQFWPPDAPDAHCFGLPYSIQFGIISHFLDVLIAPPLSLFVSKNLENWEEKENCFQKSHKSRREREFFSKNLENREEKEICVSESHQSRREREIFLKNLENQEEKENGFKNLTNREEK